MMIEENKPLAPFTTFGIGGPARWFVEASSEEEIVDAAAWAQERGTPLFVMGGGSNLLISDAGFDGMVLRVGLRGITAVQSAEKPNLDSGSLQGTTPAALPMRQNEREALHCGDKQGPVSGHDFSRAAIVAKATRALAPETRSTENPGTNSSAPAPSAQALYQAAAGEDWDAFVKRTVADDCAGIECLAGIPGTVGGTPVQNVGAYGQEVASSIERVRAFDLLERAFVEFPASECGFAYRGSRFNSADRGRYIVTRVDYRLTPGGAPTLRYADLQKALADRIAESGRPSLAEVAAVVRRVRQLKGMLLVEGDPDCRSAGSFFKNPVVSENQLREIAAAAQKDPPCFPAGLGQVKLPAAWLIEQAGFAKGYTLGASALSSRHTLALINRGGACAEEVLALASQITTAVEARFGIQLETEPVLVGF